MFTKYTKNLFDKEIVASREETPLPLPPRFFKDPQQVKEIETVLSEDVSIQGQLSFKTALRIDGSFEGELISDGKLTVGPNGRVKADISLQEAFIAGKVEGNITVKERLVLRGNAEVRGNIAAPMLSVDEGVTIIGEVKVQRAAPAVDLGEAESKAEDGFGESFL